MKGSMAVVTFLLLSGSAGAAEAPPFRVGVGGTHTSVQSALAEAVASGLPREIQVAAGRWPERLRLPHGSETPPLRLTGGWFDRFRQRTEDPSRTVIDGVGGGSVVELSLGGNSRLYMNGFTFTHGAAGSGGGVAAFLRDSAHLTLENTWIVDNQARTGAGVVATLSGGARLDIYGSTLRANRAGHPESAAGGGAWIAATDASYVEVIGNRFLENEVRTGEGAATSAALHIVAWFDTWARVHDNVFQGNRAASASGAEAVAVTLGARKDEARPNASHVLAARNQFLDEQAASGAVVLIAEPGGLVQLTDSIVARGSGDGAVVRADGGEVQITNLTVARQAGTAVSSNRTLTGLVTLSNTILFENGDEVSGPVAESHNFRGDPSFIDPAGDYHLRPGSPAIDAGHNGPPGGLGSQDIDHDARTVGRSVDIGADEAPIAGGGAGEPVCTAFPTLAATAACRCLVDPGLVEARCAALVDDVFLNLRVPIGFKAGERLKASWTIRPWEPLASAYSMDAEAFLDGQWVPQPWLGPTAPEIVDGKTVVEPFVWTLGKAITTVRTTFKYVRPGFQEPSQVTIEVRMPEPTLPSETQAQ